MTEKTAQEVRVEKSIAPTMEKMDEKVLVDEIPLLEGIVGADDPSPAQAKPEPEPPRARAHGTEYLESPKFVEVRKNIDRFLDVGAVIKYDVPYSEGALELPDGKRIYPAQSPAIQGNLVNRVGRDIRYRASELVKESTRSGLQSEWITRLTGMVDAYLDSFHEQSIPHASFIAKSFQDELKALENISQLSSILPFQIEVDGQTYYQKSLTPSTYTFYYSSSMDEMDKLTRSKITGIPEYIVSVYRYIPPMDDGDIGARQEPVEIARVICLEDALDGNALSMFIKDAQGNLKSVIESTSSYSGTVEVLEYTQGVYDRMQEKLLDPVWVLAYSHVTAIRTLINSALTRNSEEPAKLIAENFIRDHLPKVDTP